MVDSVLTLQILCNFSNKSGLKVEALSLVLRMWMVGTVLSTENVSVWFSTTLADTCDLSLPYLRQIKSKYSIQGHFWKLETEFLSFGTKIYWNLFIMLETISS